MDYQEEINKRKGIVGTLCRALDISRPAFWNRLKKNNFTKLQQEKLDQILAETKVGK